MPTDAPPLTDAAGTPLADVLLDHSLGLRWAVLTLHAPGAVVAPVVLDRLSGHRVVTDDDDLVAALVAAGGTVARRGHDYAYDLAHVPPGWAAAPVPEPYRLSPDLDPEALAGPHAAATPPGHPDHDPHLDHVADLRAMLAGEVLGPTVPGATWQVAGPDGPCGAVVVSARAMADGVTRAWVLDVFLEPRHQGRGLGAALLQRAVAGAARAGLPEMGLVVSDGNPARRRYQALGFRHVRSGSSVDVP